MFCDEDAVRILIHVKTRALFPEIKYHEETLDRIAQQFQFRSTFQIHILSDARMAEVAKAVVRALPAGACPSGYKGP